MAIKSKEEELREEWRKEITSILNQNYVDLEWKVEELNSMIWLEVKKEVREALASHQLEMEKKIEAMKPSGKTRTSQYLNGYYQAKDDTLSILRGEKKK